MSINSTVPTELLLPTSIHEKESPEWTKSFETNKKHNNKKNLKKNTSSHSRINKKVKTIQEFLTSEKRKALAREIQDKARKYKQVSYRNLFFLECYSGNFDRLLIELKTSPNRLRDQWHLLGQQEHPS